MEVVYSQCIRITEVMRTLIILASLVSLCWARTLLVETEGSEGTASLEAEGSEGRGGGTVEASTIKSWIDPETGINHFTGINEYGKEYQGEWFNPPAPFHFRNGTRMTEADLENLNLFESGEASNKSMLAYESESDGTEWFIPPAPFYFKNGSIEGYGKKTGGPSNKSLFRFTPAERRRLRKPSSQLTRAERRDKRRLKRAQRGRG